jgi:hypothetical protein
MGNALDECKEAGIAPIIHVDVIATPSQEAHRDQRRSKSAHWGPAYSERPVDFLRDEKGIYGIGAVEINERVDAEIAKGHLSLTLANSEQAYRPCGMRNMGSLSTIS